MNLFANFRIDALCLHEVFKRDHSDQEKPVNFGTKVFKLDGPAKEYLSTRLVNALGEESTGVLMLIKEPPEQGGFPIVKQCFDLTDDEGFLARSKDLAAKLSSLQTRTNIPTCVVLVVKGRTSTEDRPFVAIIKAEIHSGFAKRMDGDTITLEFAKDLFLTPEQRLFKIGIYIKRPSAGIASGALEVQHYDVFIFDSQMSATNPTGAAQYFYDGFLGCVRPQGRVGARRGGRGTRGVSVRRRLSPVCRCLNPRRGPVSGRRSSNRACGFPAHGSPPKLKHSRSSC